MGISIFDSLPRTRLLDLVLSLPPRIACCAPVFFALAAILLPNTASGQNFDPDWYRSASPYVKVAVVDDGVHRVTGAEVASAGVDLATLDPTTVQIFENGIEIPIFYDGSPSQWGTDDVFIFVGKRNTGEDELWAYNHDPLRPASRFNSLYTDTTYYWLTWGTEPGLRYNEITPPATGGAPAPGVSASIHLESDLIYYPGQGSEAGHPIYTRAEGYFQDRIAHNTSQSPITRSYSLQLENHSASPNDSLTISVLLASETISNHHVTMLVELEDAGSTEFVVVDSTVWINITVALLSATIPQNRLPLDGSLDVQLFSRNDFGSPAPNNMLVDWIEVAYTRTPTVVGGHLDFSPATASLRNYEVAGLTSRARVFALGEAETFTLDPVNGNASFSHVATPSSRYWIAEQGSELSPVRIVADASSDLVSISNGASYVILTSSLLVPSATTHADYRATEPGGHHNSIVIDVQDVFDQFDYGRPSPIAIRRFVQSAYNWNDPIRFLMLWGDALYANKSRPIPQWEVPTFGHTASDGWFAMQNEGIADYSEAISVGRAPVRSNAQGAVFSQKISDYEASVPDIWRKNAMFLVGGLTQAERVRLQQSSLAWAATAVGVPVGMDTLKFFKTSSNVLDPSFKEAIQEALREGSSWAVYFGHSATQTWEIVTDPPALYDNAQKLPVVLSLGCFTGDFATGVGDSGDLLSFSEQLVVESANGGIAHWGASSSGTIGASSRMSDEVHQSVFVDTLRTLGTALRVAKGRYNDQFSDFISVKHLLQYGLIGDPATQLVLPIAPDLRLLDSDIRISPQAPVPTDRELTTDITLRNIGLLVTDSIGIRITHFLPNGESSQITRRIPAFRNVIVESFRIPIDESSVGQNRIVVELDTDGEVIEENESNNLAEQTVTVFASGLAVVSPGQFGLFDTQDIEIIVNTSFVGSSGTSVLFQLDTAPTFDSPSLLQQEVISDGLAAAWQPPGLTDDQTYYWRARINEAGQEDLWSTGAFTIKVALGETGWYQSEALFDNNEVSSTLDPHSNGWQLRSFDLTVTASSDRGGGTQRGQFVYVSEAFERLGLGFGILIIDGSTSEVRGHGSMPTYDNDFEDPAEALQELLDLVALVQPGDYVFVRTRHLGNKNGETTIPETVKVAFRSLGSTEIDNLTYQDLWIMKTRVGFPGTLVEVVDLQSSGLAEISQQFPATFQFPDGQIISPVIGPVSEWDSVTWDAMFPNESSNVTVDVTSVSGDSILVADAARGSTPISTIDVRSTPFIRLRATIGDSLRLTTPQLTDWRVSFRPVAELAIDRNSVVVSADTVVVGESVDLSFSIRNLSSRVADTVLVSYLVTDAENRTSLVETDTLLALANEAVASATITTNALVGNAVIRAEVRQPGLVERVQSNNVELIAIHVLGDTAPPAFTFTIDGEVLPHDPNQVVNLQDPALPFVAVRPLIQVEVSDDFPFADLSEDSTAVVLILDQRKVAQSLLSVSTSDDGRSLTVQFEPDFSNSDSTHTLLLEVRDAGGNKAPDSPYQVHFRTQTAIEMESVYPYPNPMSSFTTFAFRLLGADALDVDELDLRIYTVSGRLVREFDLLRDPGNLEAGQLKIGWNKLRWDGRDADGDRVATGVYLYRVSARADGQELLQGSNSKVEKVVVIR